MTPITSTDIRSTPNQNCWRRRS